MSIFNKILGDPNEKKLNSFKFLINDINNLESKFEKLSDERLRDKTKEFKLRLKKGESLDKILPEAFATVREASKRTLKQRHFDVQLICGIVLHQGQISEMKTGEGKTLAATLAVYLNALTEKGVHVVTVNDYLARRDAGWMGEIYNFLGISCACLNHEKAYIYDAEIEVENLREVSRKEAYQADITYGTNNEFGFDYLRDNMAPTLEAMVQRQEPYFTIVDEVDSVLIDEARTPLIISAPDAESTQMYQKFAGIIPQLEENTDYNIDEKMRAATLSEQGIAKVEKILGMGNIYEQGGIRTVHHLEQALRAQVLFIKDRHYVVKNNQVIIVDDFTGRLMPGRRYSDGLHQALEAKENVSVQQESRTLASITFQNYFRLYEKLAGMTGTAVTSAEEFGKVYKLEVVVIPTNLPIDRQDLQDSIYRTEKGKIQAIVREVSKRHEQGQPILIGTVSIEKNELISAHLTKAGVPHKVLNAKHHEQEAHIISQAGRKGAVTVATNMAGRGVDIVLGGKLENGEQNKQEHDEVIKAGGLCVIGTERHEARRIDDQLRGRSGRQGDPGSSQFFVSLEDDLMRIFGGEKVKSMMEMLKLPEDQPIENKFISKAIESAQGKIEGYNFDARNHVLEYDDVMNKQREIIYKKRKETLSSNNIKNNILDIISKEIKKIINFHGDNYKEISEIIKSIFISDITEEVLKKYNTPEEIYNYINNLALKAYENKEKEMGENMRQLEKFVVLRNIDSLWMDHIDNMGHLRDSVRLRAYGQKDPLIEYKREGINLFQKLLDTIQSNIVSLIYKFALAPAHNASHNVAGRPAGKDKVGRNAPCPCNSGKKYKKCCGR